MEILTIYGRYKTLLAIFRFVLYIWYYIIIRQGLYFKIYLTHGELSVETCFGV